MSFASDAPRTTLLRTRILAGFDQPVALMFDPVAEPAFEGRRSLSAHADPAYSEALIRDNARKGWFDPQGILSTKFRLVVEHR